jgi:hypothetical protein
MVHHKIKGNCKYGHYGDPYQDAHPSVGPPIRISGMWELMIGTDGRTYFWIGLQSFLLFRASGRNRPRISAA